MIRLFAPSACLLTAFVLLRPLSLNAQTVGSYAYFASGEPLGLTQPSAILTTSKQTVWVSYTNGAAQDGTSGNSTVVEYDTFGRVIARYDAQGSVDGLKEDPVSHQVWALQNQMGNSALSIIDPDRGVTPGSPFRFANASPTRGYRDVAFLGGRTLLTYTNPLSTADPTVQTISATPPPLQVQSVLFGSATGLNLDDRIPGQPTAQIAPNTIRVTPAKDAMMTSRSNGQIIFIRDSGTPSQKVAFLNVIDEHGQPVSGLEDALFPHLGQGLFFLSNPSKNRVAVVYIYDIRENTLVGLIESMNALAKIDLQTGVATPILRNLGGYRFIEDLPISGGGR